MTPIGNAALLVARILQPLARSLEEARRHLDLETVTSDEATDDTAPAPAPAPPYFAAPGSRRAFDRIAAREGDTALVTPPAVHPDAPETWPGVAPASTPQPGTAAAARNPGTPAAPRFMRVVTENRLAPPLQVSTPASDTDATTARLAPPPASLPAFFARHATRSVAAAEANAGTANSPPPEIAAAGVATGKHPTSPHTPQLRVLAAPHAAPLAGDETGPAATPLTRPTHPTPHLAPVPPHQAPPPAPDANPPGPASGTAARQPLPSAATPTAPRHWRLRPAAHADLATPAARTAQGNPAREAAFESANKTPRQSPSSAPGPATAPSQLPRNPALTRVLQAMDPVLDKAWQLTDAALSPDPTPAPTGADAPRVSNNFNVSVALGDASSAAGRDPQQLQDALVALLRDAARRQGLDV